jgi:hypothetical protein
MGNSKVKVSDSQASAQALAVVSGVGSAVAVGVVLVVVLVAELVGSLEPDSRRKRTIKKVNVSDVQHKICCCHPIIHYRSCASLNAITKYTSLICASNPNSQLLVEGSVEKLVEKLVD